MEPGVHEITAEEYHADPAPEPSLSSSIARLLVDASPLHAWWNHPRLNPDYQRTTTNALSFGSLCHRLLLEEGARVALWQGKDWRTKEAREFRNAALENGEIPVTAPQYEKAEKVVEAARKQLAQHGIGSLQAELTWLVDALGGDWLRCMTDWFDSKNLIVYDYKTTQGSAEPQSVARAAANLGYDFQQAFYERVIVALKPELAGRLRFRFIFQEIEPPYALSVVSLSEADVEIARHRVDVAVSRWANCLKVNEWPGYPSEVVRIALPEWRMREWLNREMEEGT